MVYICLFIVSVYALHSRKGDSRETNTGQGDTLETNKYYKGRDDIIETNRHQKEQEGTTEKRRDRTASKTIHCGDTEEKERHLGKEKEAIKRQGDT